MRIVCLILLFVNQTLYLSAQTCKVPLGGTLAPLYWNNNPCNWFVDYMKMSKPGFGPVTGPWNPGAPALTTDGWPTEPFSVWVKLKVYPHDLGVYHLEFEGFADLQADIGIELFDNTYHPATNKTTAKVRINATANQIALFFRAPMSPVVRDIKLIAPGFDPNNYPTFHPDWVEHASRFPLLRYMTWNAANTDATVTWQDRKLPNSPTQTGVTSGAVVGTGIAWEYVIEMANLTNTHVWINLPVLADDDYMHNLAILLKQKLHIQAQIHLELGNEVWNQAHFGFYALRLRAQQEVNAGGSNLNYDGSTSPDTWAMRLYARRTKVMHDIFLQHFGQQAFNTKIFTILGHQVVVPSNQLKTGLEYLQEVYGSPNQYISAVAGAPFLSVLQLDTVSNLTVQRYFQLADQQLNRLFRAEDNFLIEGITYATYYKVSYRSHEAGIDSYLPPAAPKALRDTVAAAHQDPRMAELMRQYLHKWYSNTGTEGYLTWFVVGATDYTGGDTYGLTTSVYDLETIKTQSIDAMLNTACPPLQSGHVIPGSVDARQYARYPANWASQAFNQVVFQGNSHQYLVRNDGNSVTDFCLSVAVETPQFAEAIFALFVDNQTIDTIVLPGGQILGIDTVHFANLALSPGLHTVRLKYLSWCYGTHTLIFETGSQCTTPTVHLPNAAAIQLFPNPNTGTFSLSNVKKGTIVRVFNALGQLVHQEQKASNSADTPLHLVTQWADGMYTVQADDQMIKMCIKRK